VCVCVHVNINIHPHDIQLVEQIRLKGPDFFCSRTRDLGRCHSLLSNGKHFISYITYRWNQQDVIQTLLSKLKQTTTPSLLTKSATTRKNMSNPVNLLQTAKNDCNLSQSPALSAHTISTIHDQECSGTPLNTSWSWFLDKYIHIFGPIQAAAGSTYVYFGFLSLNFAD